MLEIKDVHPSCGCTTAGEWSRQVEPGQTGTIPIQFNSGNFTGQIGKSISVTCNDPAQPTETLHIKGTVWRPIDVIPQSAILNLSAESPSNATTVRIINNLEEPLTLSNLQCKSSAFAAELTTNQPGKAYSVLIKTVPPWPTNSVNGQVTLQTSATQMNLITITAWANVQPVLTAMPSVVTLPAGPLTNKLTLLVWIRNNGTNTLALSEAAVNAKGVDVSVQASQPGRYYYAEITFPTGFTVPPGEKVEFSVKSNHPQYPIIKVPITQPPGPATGS